MRRGDVRKDRSRRRTTPPAPTPPSSDDPEPGHAGHEEHHAPGCRASASSGRDRAGRPAARRRCRAGCMAKRLPGMSGWRACSANSQAQTTTKAGFMNSDGWIERPAKRHPAPRALDLDAEEQSTSTISTSATISMISAVRRTCRGVRKETPSIAPAPGSVKTIWRCDEVEAVEADALGHRRARREGQHDAEPHQRAGTPPGTSDRSSTTRSARPDSCRRRLSIQRASCRWVDQHRDPISAATARRRHRRAPRNS